MKASEIKQTIEAMDFFCNELSEQEARLRMHRDITDQKEANGITPTDDDYLKRGMIITAKEVALNNIKQLAKQLTEIE